MTLLVTDPDIQLTTLANGARVVAVRLPHLHSVCASVFVRAGSRYESRRQNGISHVVEHMAFKGTRERTCQQINLDAERLGAEVNAHTDKDHTAYHMRGLARDSSAFIRMLGDIVLNSQFPEAELERERQVILQEVAEDQDDPLSSAFKLFDRTCFGDHPQAQPVIGTPANIRRFQRADLVDYVGARYNASNLVIGVAGAIDPDAVCAQAEAAFGAMPRGTPQEPVAPAYHGGIAARGQAGIGQTHLVMGWPIPSLREDPVAEVLAAAVFGEGMSSPLLDELRERRGLVYYAACSADLNDLCGQFVIEASTAPEQIDPFFPEVIRLLIEQAAHAHPQHLERARNQLAVRSLAALEQPYRRLEEAALDLFALGRVRSRQEWWERVQAVTPEQVRDAFERMLSKRCAVAMAGRVRRGVTERVAAWLAAPAGAPS